MKKIIFIFLALVLVGLMAYFVKDGNRNIKQEYEPQNRISESRSEESGSQNEAQIEKVLEEEKDMVFALPIEKAGERVTKKSFGTFVTPQNSPVSPERFYGYHSAVDFEILPGEEDEAVEIRAICSGEILSKRSASGYGGVVVQKCQLEDRPITVIYGHLNLNSVKKDIGEYWERGEVMGILGKGYSSETDNERKHLHLGIHKGESLNILGYVQSREALDEWIDPCIYFCEKEI